MAQRVRISDIAAELGLSTATVSNVIHGKTGKVSDETVRRVQALLEERQYIPSMAGILLAQNASRIVGVFVNDHEKYEGHTLEDAFIASSLNHLLTEIEARGQFMMVKKAREAQEILQFASMWNMDGVIIIGFCQQDYMYLRSHMRVPFVVYDGFCETPERFVNITLDNYDGGRQVGALFRRLGYTRAVCIADNDIGVDRERIDGFRAGFEQDVDALIVPMQRTRRIEKYSTELERIKHAGAVFAVSDQYAVELIRVLHQNGVSVPDEVSVAGFDDIPLAQLVHPALTTVRQDGALRARLALDKLKELCAGVSTETEIKLPVTLVERCSTKAH